MGRVYTIAPAAFTPGSAKTIVEFMAAAAKHCKVRRFRLSSDDTGGTTAVDVLVLRLTAGGTASAVTARPHNVNDSGAGFTAKYNHSVEPTAGVDLDRFKWNIQVPYEVVLGPGEEYDIPGATNQGFAIELLDNPGDSITLSVEVEEI
jgi:hypothetical protein